MKNSMLVTVLLIFSTAVQAGPFGLDMGTPLADLKRQMKLKLVKPAYYSTHSVPKSHPDFNEYRLLVTPAHGLCKIVAWSKVVSTSVYGTELVSKFSALESALTTKYGNPTQYDFLREGSIWSERRDWMMGLHKSERTLKSYWTNEDRELPENVQAIELEAMAISIEQATVKLAYEFKNADDCVDWIKSQKNSAL
jgi:hypothetical protein